MPDTSDAPNTRTIIAAATDAPGRAEDLAARLRRVLPADAVVSGAECARWAIAGEVPLAVAVPPDVEGVRAALGVANELGAAVVPWGRGTRQARGRPPTSYDLALSLARLDAVTEPDPAGSSVTAQAGITHAALNRRLAESGQMLPLDVARPRMATLGGTLACATPGLRRSTYGGVRELALGLRVLSAAGDDVNGDDVSSELQIGALGTLGIIVAARLKVLPLPETETTLLGIFGDVAAALELVPALASLVPSPAALAIVRAAGLSPLAHLASTHGGRALLAVRLAGAATPVARAGQVGRAVLRRAGARTILSVEPELQDAYWGPVLDFTRMDARRSDEALLRIEATPEETADVIRQTAEVGGTHGLRAAELADALSGTVWLRLRAATDSVEGADRGGVALASALARALPTVCAALRARWPRTTLLDCPAALALEPDVWSVWSAPPSPATRAALTAARQRIDPAGLLNPGRYPLEVDRG